MDELKEEYKETRRALNRAYESLKQLRDAKREQQLKLMAKLTDLTTWEDKREQLELKIAQLETDMKLIGQMRSDIEYVIEWLETGKRPGNKRGIERRAAYQRERPVDPLKLQAYVSGTTGGGHVQAVSITDRELDRIEFALGQLSPRERECYEMVRGNGLSFANAAELLEIEKTTVQWYVEVADTKLRHHIRQADLFDYL